MIVDYANRYEMEIVHDILYKARGKGYVTETEIFNMAYPMIMGFDRNENYPYVYSELNFLQSYQIFDSLKRLVSLEKMQVKADKESKENGILFYMYAAQKVKSGVYPIVSFPPRLIHRHYYCNRDDYTNLLQNLYGLTDGIIKSRFELGYSHFRRASSLCGIEMSHLSHIAKRHN